MFLVIFLLARVSPAAEEAPKSLQGVELLFPIDDGAVPKDKKKKDAKAEKTTKRQAALLKKLKAIEKGGDINAADKKGQTALMQAAAANNRLAVCWLVAKGADVTLKNKKGKTARDLSSSIATRELLRLAANENTQVSAEESEKARALKKDRNAAGVNKLGVECYAYLGEIALLMKAGEIDPYADAEDGYPLLACSCLTPECAAYLIRRHVSLHKRTTDGHSALGKKTSRTCALLYLSLGFVADETKESELPVALQVAVLRNDAAKAQQLLREHRDIIKQFGANIILYATTKEMAALLLTSGAEKMALNEAVWNKAAPGAVAALLEAGAGSDPKRSPAPDCAADAATVNVLMAGGQKAGETSLGEALSYRRFDAAKALVSHGAKTSENALDELMMGVRFLFEGATLSDDWRSYTDAFLRIPEMIDTLGKAGVTVDESTFGTWYYAFGDKGLLQLGFCEDLPLDLHAKASYDAVRRLLKLGVNPPKDILARITFAGEFPEDAAKQIVQLLLDSGADPCAVSDKGSTVLTQAGKNHPTITKLLLDKGADPNVADAAGQTPVFFGHNSVNSAAIYALLRQHGAKVDVTDKKNNTPLTEYLWGGGNDTKLIGRMLADGVNVNARNSEGLTALHMAHSVEIARLLLDAGANVKNADQQVQIFPILWKYSDDAPDPRVILPLCHFMKDHGAKVDVENIMNGNISSTYPPQKFLEILQFLADGTDIVAYRTPQTKQSFLHGTARRGWIERARALLNAGIDANVRDGNGRTPLMCVEVSTVAREMTEFLLQNGADVNAKDNDGRTPLMYVALSKYRNPGFTEEMIDILLRNGADINVKDKDGKTALKLAKEAKWDYIVKLLEERGVKE